MRPYRRVAGVQFDIVWEDPEANFEKVRRLAHEAREDDVALLVLPEMFATGFSMNAESMAKHAKKTREFLSNLAQENNMWVLGGFAEPTTGRPKNAATVTNPEGREVTCYQKIHPFAFGGESDQFDSGDKIFTTDVDGLRLTPFICYDLRFPEIFRAATESSEFFAVIASWPETRRQHWIDLLKARAIENQAYVLGVNRTGEGGGLRYAGDSLLIDPLGSIIDQAGTEERLVKGEVRPDFVTEIRKKLPFHKDRREDLYAKLRETLSKEPSAS